MVLYLVRHGKTSWNKLGLLQGESDIPLNKEGKDSALKLKEYFSDKNIDICFSSPLKRAYDTAKIIFPDLNIVISNQIIERFLGQFEGKNYQEYNFADYWDYEKNSNDLGVEPIQTLLKRSELFLNYLRENYYDKNVVVVSHKAFIKALHYTIIGYDKNTNFNEFTTNNCEIKKYEL